MSEPSLSSKLGRLSGVVLIVLGVSVFLIRLQHAGPYDPPEGGNLLAALVSLVLGGLLVGPWLANAPSGVTLRRVCLVAVLPAVFFSLYATLAEVEEVVVLEAVDRAGDPVGLRLWIVEYEGAAWVQMPRAKATEHGLETASPVFLLRHGERICVVPALFEDRTTTNAVHRTRHEKYLVQRLATAVGLFGRDANPTTVALRLDACAERPH